MPLEELCCSISIIQYVTHTRNRNMLDKTLFPLLGPQWSIITDLLFLSTGGKCVIESASVIKSLYVAVRFHAVTSVPHGITETDSFVLLDVPNR